tara:strand:- start:4523 stop:5395 length:873 start_codon:yes stop_codon:yes gene_type:complete
MIDLKNQNNIQQTLSKPITIEGIGLHSGINVSMKLLPAKADEGIKFYRTDLSYGNEIRAIWSNVSNTELSTTISNEVGASVSTVEHLMSALSGLHIDNLKIEINGPEVPIMDGSSKEFVSLIDKVPLKTLSKKRKTIKIKKNIKVIKNDSFVELKPNNKFSIDFEIDFPSKFISKQSCHLQLINGNYKSDIASARTFGFEKDVDLLRSKGLALGGSLRNAVVIGEDKILNEEGLRFKDEFVRHKILDSIGDLYLAGFPIQGYFFGNKSGHFLNNLILKSLFSDESNYEFV